MKRVVPFLVLAALLLAVGARTAVAAPSSIEITPLVAPTGTPVAVTGVGCSSAVQLTGAGVLFPSPPAVTVDLAVTPEIDGTWAAEFPMPSVPSFLLVSCDGVVSDPIVIAPNDVPARGLAPSDVTETEVVISTSPLVDGSAISVFDESGNLVGISTVVGGIGTVVVSRSLGPATVLVVGLRQQDAGVALPYIPLSREVQLPLAAPVTIDVEPTVEAPGSIVTASGVCTGSARLMVLGRPNGWFDPAPVYVDVAPVVATDGLWNHEFALPALPSRAQVTCGAAGIQEVATELISPSEGDFPSLLPSLDGNDVVVELPLDAQTEPLKGFTATGVPVSITVADGTVRFQPPSTPIRVLLVGVESLGENAEALQVSRVQTWSIDVAGEPPASTSTTSTTTTSSIATTSSTTTPTPPRPVMPDPTIPIGGLPETGTTSGTLAALAALALLAGTGLVVAVRRAR